MQPEFAVQRVTPADGSVVTEAPVAFSVQFSDRYAANSLQASDLTVNGIPASRISPDTSNTASFQFASSPVRQSGLQTIELADSAVIRDLDEAGLRAHTSFFYFDETPLAVIRLSSTTTASAGSLELIVDFSDALDPASVDTHDLRPSLGEVVGAELIDDDSVRYSLEGVNQEVVQLVMAEGAVSDAAGNPLLAHSEELSVDVDQVPLTVLGEVGPSLLIHEARLTGAVAAAEDRDTYTIDLHEGESLTTSIAGIDTASEWIQTLVILDPTGGEILRESASEPHQDIIGSIVASQSGPYSLVVSSANAMPGRYQLRALVNAVFELEDGGNQNDTLASAESLPSLASTTHPQRRTAVLGTLTDDTDVFQVQLEAGDIASLIFQQADQTGGLEELRIVDANERLIAEAAPSDVRSTVLPSFQVPSTGNYFVLLKGDGDYALQIGADVGFEVEPNDIIDRATQVGGAAQIWGHVESASNAAAMDEEPNDDGQGEITAADLPFANDHRAGFRPFQPGVRRLTLQGEITFDDRLSHDFHRIHARPGDQLTVHMDSVWTDTHPTFDARIWLVDNEANELAESYEYGTRDARLEFEEFDYVGDYYLVTGSDRAGQGSYEVVADLRTEHAFEDTRDVYSIFAEAGSEVSLAVTPFSSRGHLLDPGFEVIDPTGAAVPHENTLGLEGVVHTAPVSGNYEVRVFAEHGTSGDYVLNVAGHAVRPFEVIDSDPANATHLSRSPRTIQVEFNYDVRLDSLSPGDLTVDGLASTGVELVTPRVVEFELPDVETGEHGVAVAADAIESTLGVGNREFISTFLVDRTPPVVIASNVSTGDVVNGDGLDVELRFSQALASETLHDESVILRGERVGEVPLRAIPSFDDSTNTLVLKYGDVPDDAYTLELDGREIKDLLGHQLDGEPSFPLPSGDGRQRGDFVVDFETDATMSDVSLRQVEGVLGTASRYGEIDGYYHAGDPDDTYRLELRAGQFLSLSYAGDSGQAVVFEGPGTRVTVDAGETGSAVMQAIPILESGDYFIKAQSADGAEGSYRISVSTNALVEHEGNNRAEDAQRIAASLIPLWPDAEATTHAFASTLGRIDGNRDVDWYRLPAADVVALVATPQNGGEIKLDIYDAMGESHLATGVRREDHSHVVPEVLTSDEFVLLRVEGATDTRYSLVATNTHLAGEHHDSTATAQNVRGDSVIVGNLWGTPPLGIPPEAAPTTLAVSPAVVPDATAVTEPAIADAATEPSREVVPGQLIVALRDGVSMSDVATVVEQHDAAIVDVYAFIRAVLVDLGADVDIAEAAVTWGGFDWVRYAEPNYAQRQTVTSIPNDVHFDRLWGLKNESQFGGVVDADIDAASAWEIFRGSRDVVIASIDTGVDYTHPDLVANIWTNPGEIPGDGIDNDGNGYIDDVHGIDAIDGDSDPMDDPYDPAQDGRAVGGHGTHTAGTMGAVGDNGIGVAGVNWETQIMALRILDDDDSSNTAAQVEAIEYMVRMKRDFGVNIVASNNSWTWGNQQALEDAIQASVDAGIMFVAAAGNAHNDNDVNPTYPNSYPSDGVISVAATDRLDSLVPFSNFGTSSVDLGAPGSYTYSTVLSHDYAYFSGTSMASPHVAGAVALLSAWQPGAPLHAVKKAIMEGVVKLPSLENTTVAGGRLNLANSLRLMGDAGDYYRYEAKPGDSMTIQAEKVFAGDELELSLELFGPDGKQLAVTGDSSLSIVADQLGVYTVRVFAVEGSGDYVLSVDLSATASRSPFVVTAVTPGNGSVLAASPSRVEVTFSDFLDPESLDGSDLLINNEALARDVELIDGRTALFRIRSQPEGPLQLRFDEGSIQNVHGMSNQAFTSELFIDETGPLVVSSSIREGQVLPLGELSVEVVFNEPMSHEASDARFFAIEGDRGRIWHPSQVRFDAERQKARLDFSALADDAHTLRVVSGRNGVKDAVGNPLDGNADGGRDDYEVSFVVDIDVSDHQLEPRRLRPFAGLMGRTQFDGYLHEENESDAFQLEAVAGETVSVAFTPLADEASIQLRIDNEIIESSQPGEPVWISNHIVDASGLFEFELSSDRETQYELDVVVNATSETIVGLANADVAIGLDESLIGLGQGRRYAAFGIAEADEDTGDTGDTDRYTIDLTGLVGLPVTVALASQGQDLGDETLRLLAPDGTLLETASPVDGGHRILNYDLGIHDWVVPRDGVYTIEFSSTVSAEYALLVTNSILLEQEYAGSVASGSTLEEDAVFLGALGGSDSGSELYVASFDGAYGRIDTRTGAFEPIATLPHFVIETEFVPESMTMLATMAHRQNHLQGLLQFDAAEGAPWEVLTLDSPYQAMEFIDGTLHGARNRGLAELRTMDLETGETSLWRRTDLARIDGLAYDEQSGLLYATATRDIDDDSSWLYTIDLETGVPSRIRSTRMELRGLEFGPDGQLYGVGTGDDAGKFVSINPKTARTTLISDTGLGSMRGLALGPRGYVDPNVDRFTIAAESGRAIDLQAHAFHSELEIAITVRDPAGNPVAASHAGRVTFAAADTGNYFVEVERLGGEGAYWVSQGTRSGLLAGDADGDAKVDFADFIALTASFGRDDASWELGDFNGDREVSFADFVLLSINYGQQPSVSSRHAAAVDSLMASHDLE